jgi:bifunctional UDP-N-acetylglucosamine pyrophosphorylase/glucosamine-1-phosphate N-acetyltransferase
MKKFTVIILAAGKGKRMKSPCPKALELLSGKPLIYYVISQLLTLKNDLSQIVVVTGHKGQAVKKAVRDNFPGKKIEFVNQARLSGTAKAVEVTSRAVKCSKVLVICADTPLIVSRTIKKFIHSFLKKKLLGSVLTAWVNQKNSLGLILRDQKGRLKAIREKSSLPNQVGPQEVNSGIYCFQRKALFSNLPKINKDKVKKEYFLTDLIEILYNAKGKLGTYLVDDSKEILGINNQLDLQAAESIIGQRLIEAFAAKGVRILDPKTTFIQEGVKIGKNSLIYPFTFIGKDAIIGKNCSLGPFVHLRGGTCIGDNTCVGSFLEINRSKIGKHVRVKHFGYLGDADVGDKVNIGAGTVTANFNGKSKHKTYIETEAFIGSDTVLVAPLKVGKGAVTGAGSVVTKNVKPKTTVVGVPARAFKSKKRGRR